MSSKIAQRYPLAYRGWRLFPESVRHGLARSLRLS